MSEKFIITAALPYANGPLHIGHLSGVYLPADIYTRYLRWKKKDVIFLSGSDEHGIPIVLQANKKKVSPIELINKYNDNIKKSLYRYNISLDGYYRTTDDLHIKTVIDLFMKLYKKGIFYSKYTYRFFDTVNSQFLADKYILGECRFCHNINAYGDQCENCGYYLSVSDLINPRSSISNTKLIKKKTKHWYISLSKYLPFLNNWLFENKNKWKLEVYNLVKSWIKHGIKSRSITRDLNWGINVPIINKNSNNNKVLYVWFEAPIGYISFTKKWCKINKKDWKCYLKNKSTKLIHFIGKDNIIFHCVIFPIILMLSEDYILPSNIVVNNFLNLDNKKISTSNKWTINLDDFSKKFKNQEDLLRYFLIKIMPEKKDSNFTWKLFKKSCNTELISILCNFIYRVTSLVKKINRNIIPKYYKFSFKDDYLFLKLKNMVINFNSLIKKYEFKKSFNIVFNICKLGNKFLNIEKPWSKNLNNNRLNTVLYISMQIVVLVLQLLYIFLPSTSVKILNILNVKIYDYYYILNNINSLINYNHKIKDLNIIFSKI